MQKILGTMTIAASLLASSTAWAADTYVTDQGHTEVIFGWNHAGVSRQHGEFEKATGTLKIDVNDVESASIEVTIDTASLSTGFEALDTHLKSADYFNVAAYPDITFKSTSVSKTGDTTADIVGDLTIHGKTKSVTLKADLTHKGAHPVAKFLDYYNGDWLAFKVVTELNNMDFGVGAFPTGPITIEINTEMKKQ